jgi:hypothetical protein
MLFNKNNYQIMLAGIVLIIIGFWLMAGKDDIYGFVKITLAPILIVAGLVVELYAILHTPKNRQ